MQVRPEHLKRKLGLFPLTNIVIANMIGAGIFTTSGLLMADLGDPVLLLGLWLAGGVLALFGALCYGELGAAMPEAGGEYVFLSRLVHPLFGFLSGWVSFVVGFSAPIAASSIGFSEYFVRAFPRILDLGNSTGLINPLGLKKILSVLVIVLFTGIHLRGIEFGTKIQNCLTALKVLIIAGIVVLGFSAGRGSFHHFTMGERLPMNVAGLKTAGLSLMWIMFAYSGWNASTYIGAEIKDPRANLPRSLLLGTAIVMFLYICLNAIYVYAMPPENMKGVISIGGLAMKSLFGVTMEIVFSLFIAFALLSSLSAFIILGPRVYYAMAQQGHFFRFVSRIHPVFHVPSKAIWLQAFLAVFMALSGTFDQILTYMGFSLGIFPILAVLGVIKLRHRPKRNAMFPGYPFIPIFYAVASSAMLILAFFERPVESSIAMATVVAGIPLFFVFQKRGR